MQRIAEILLSSLLVAGLFAACTNEPTPPPESAGMDRQAPMPAARGAAGRSGVVTETMDAGGYTYVQVDTGAETFWAAAPEFVVQVGDAVVVPAGMPMEQYHSNTLDRDFDVVYFVDAVQVGGGDRAAGAVSRMPAGHPDIQPSAAPDAADLADVEKVDGGYTVGEIFAQKAGLAGKAVSVRGKVVKFNAGIMGKNWLHIQDGTGEPGRNDLTVTTRATARVGDTVVINGMVATDRDFGFGYAYEVLVEDADVIVE